MARIVYAQGRPYGAPLTIIRGGATRTDEVKAFLRESGYRWNDRLHGYEWYAPSDDDFRAILVALRDRFGCEVVPKEGLDPGYVIDLNLASSGNSCRTGTFD